MTPVTQPVLTRWMWLAAALLMLGEFLLFDRMTSRHYAPLYPRWNDQIQYLADAYHAYDELHDHGLGAGLKFALGKNAVQGTLHDTCAVLVFWVVGSASRSAALSLNMVVFLAWQAALLFTIPRLSGSRSLGWMAFGLVLCVAYPWSGTAGSAVDFRLDHGAMCLFGITACALLLSDGFRARGWSLLFGAATGITMLERFLTGAYFVPLFLATGAWLLFQRERGARLLNLVLAAAVVILLALPVFWINRQGIKDYYWVGQVTGAESAARLRGFDLWQSLQFVMRNFWEMHLGAWLAWTAAGLTGLLLLLAFARRRPQPATPSAAGWLWTGLVFFLVPAFILTFHQQKSEVVLGILVPGALLLVLWLWQILWRRIEWSGPSGWGRMLPALPALVAVGAGVAYFVRCEIRPAYPPYFLESAQKVNWAAEYIFITARANGVTQPDVGIDRVTDFLDGRILRLMCYEKHRVWIDFGVHLPDSILAGPDDAVLFKMKHCDFMILTDDATDFGFWPYDLQMRRLHPELQAWCDGNLRSIGIISAFDREMTFYQRRDFH